MCVCTQFAVFSVQAVCNVYVWTILNLQCCNSNCVVYFEIINHTQFNAMRFGQASELASALAVRERAEGGEGGEQKKNDNKNLNSILLVCCATTGISSKKLTRTQCLVTVLQLLALGWCTTMEWRNSVFVTPFVSASQNLSHLWTICTRNENRFDHFFFHYALSFFSFFSLSFFRSPRANKTICVY